MNLDQHVIKQFEASIELQQRSMELLTPAISEASTALVGTLLSGNKILCCGIGGSATSAQQMALELVNRFETERPGLPALAITADGSLLTAIAADTGFKHVFARQVRALGQTGDALLLLASDGVTASLIEAVRAAHARGMRVVALTSLDGSRLIDVLSPADINISVPGKTGARVQEVHSVILHCLCHLIDIQLFGGS